MNGPAPAVGGAELLPSPGARGWRLASEIHDGDDDGLSVIPRSGHCSIPHCVAATTAAVRRGPSRLRPGFWQPYCRDHARARGVVTREGLLEWAEGFGKRSPGPPRRR